MAADLAGQVGSDNAGRLKAVIRLIAAMAVADRSSFLANKLIADPSVAH